MAGTAKTSPGHKAHPVYGMHYSCSCGWSSSTWYGKGAQRNAASELRSHKEREAAKQNQTIECEAA